MFTVKGSLSVTKPLSLSLQGNSSSCGASCEFLEQLNSFASIQDGDGSKIPTPSIPRVINMDLTSLSLQWDPVQNASGTPVYLVTVNTMGDYSSTYTNVRIYHSEPWKPQGRYCWASASLAQMSSSLRNRHKNQTR